MKAYERLSIDEQIAVPKNAVYPLPGIKKFVFVGFIINLLSATISLTRPLKKLCKPGKKVDFAKNVRSEVCISLLGFIWLKNI
jgi:hypothetical protein